MVVEEAAAAPVEGDRVLPFPGLSEPDAVAAAGLNPALEAAYAAIAAADFDTSRAAILPVDDTAGPSMALGDLAAGARAALAARVEASLAALAAVRDRLTADAGDDLSPDLAIERIAALLGAVEDEGRRLAADASDHRAEIVAVAAAGAADPCSAGSAAAAIAEAIGLAGPQRRLALLFVGLDRMDRIDRAHGAGTAGEVRAAVTRAITQSFADLGTVHRHDDDTFAVVLAGTSLRQSVAVGEHLRRLVMRKTLVRRSSGAPIGHITLSVGAVCRDGGDLAPALVARAERCLAAAQAAGGNRVVCETDPVVAVRQTA